VETTARLAGLEAGGGCAAKYAAGRLQELLTGFAPADSENLLVGLSPADDAAVYRLDDERVLIFTTDFFPAMVDDPAVFGAVAVVLTFATTDLFLLGVTRFIEGAAAGASVPSILGYIAIATTRLAAINAAYELLEKALRAA